MEKEDSNIGKWNDWYEGISEEDKGSFRYGDTVTYKKAADFLNDCKTVEDWGCGVGGFLRFCEQAIGVDGSDTPFASKKFIDLCDYVFEVEGVHIRHVFEHNYNWKPILENALKSAKNKLVITMFIPLGEETKEIAHNKQHGVDVPDMLISESQFFEIVNKHNPKSIVRELFDTATGYGKEEMFFIEF